MCRNKPSSAPHPSFTLDPMHAKNPISCLAEISKQSQFLSIYKIKIKKCHLKCSWLNISEQMVYFFFFSTDLPHTYLRVQEQRHHKPGLHHRVRRVPFSKLLALPELCAHAVLFRIKREKMKLRYKAS